MRLPQEGGIEEETLRIRERIARIAESQLREEFIETHVSGRQQALQSLQSLHKRWNLNSSGSHKIEEILRTRHMDLLKSYGEHKASATEGRLTRVLVNDRAALQLEYLLGIDRTVELLEADEQGRRGEAAKGWKVSIKLHGVGG
jgi:hypothetical protein